MTSDMSSTTPIDAKRLSRASNRHWAVQRNGGLKAAFAMIPYQISSRRILKTIILERDYDVVIATDHCSGIFLNPTLKTKFKILRRQNIEADYALRMAQQIHNPVIKAFFLKESWLFKRWHRHIDPMVNQIWYISTEEIVREAHNLASDNTAQHCLVPSALGGENFQPVAESAFTRGRVLYFGSLTVPINRQAVDWLVDAIHPLIRSKYPSVDLVIAGRTNANMKNWVQRHKASKDYLFFADPEDAEAIYAPGGVFIDPLAHDAGIKIKILEAIRRGYAVVCSPKSLYGSGLIANEHALVAESSSEMAEAVTRLLNNPKEAVALARAAQDRMREHFNIERDIQASLAMLEQ
jgi:polysaccharide biosynthesis protein PslH